MNRIQLHKIARVNETAKDDVLSLGLFVADPNHYRAVKAQLTPEAIKSHFGNLLKGTIRRYEIDHLQSLKFVMSKASDIDLPYIANFPAELDSWCDLLSVIEIELTD